MTGTAVVTGASSGIGAATARRLAADGYSVFCVARRLERLEALAAEIGGTAIGCDVTSPEQVEALGSAVGPRLDVLVNNAGGALGYGPALESTDEQWQRMFSMNVVGTLAVTRALMPALVASGNGLLINLTSTAAHEAYLHGGGYTATKTATSILTQTLRQEFLGQPVRITELAPGMVATEEFGLVRFDGDHARRDAIYAGVPGPLAASDVADTVGWIAGLPWHMNVDLLVLKPRDQASQTQINRVPD